MRLDGQVAIVTGGASGLAEATARYLAARGCDVAVLDSNGDRAKQVAAEIGGYEHQCDVTDAEQAAVAVTSAMARFGQAARICVYCAGVGTAARIVGREGGTSLDVFRRVIEVNLIGKYNVMTYAVQAMMDLPVLENGERGGCGEYGLRRVSGRASGAVGLAASKGAIAAMCLPLARPGIRVCAIAPGLFNTPMMESLPEATTAAIVANVPFPPRLGHPMEFGQLVAAIVENSYLNGEVIRLDRATRLPPK